MLTGILTTWSRTTTWKRWIPRILRLGLLHFSLGPEGSECQNMLVLVGRNLKRSSGKWHRSYPERWGRSSAEGTNEPRSFRKKPTWMPLRRSRKERRELHSSTSPPKFPSRRGKPRRTEEGSFWRASRKSESTLWKEWVRSRSSFRESMLTTPLSRDSLSTGIFLSAGNALKRTLAGGKNRSTDTICSGISSRGQKTAWKQVVSTTKRSSSCLRRLPSQKRYSSLNARMV